MLHNFDLINKLIFCKRDVLKAFETKMSDCSFRIDFPNQYFNFPAFPKY